MPDLFTRSEAKISDCQSYRYWLQRTWGPGWPQVFIMLNPSTADANLDDPTIRRCIDFARREKAGGLIVVNLFAYRATDPGQLTQVDDPVGPENAQSVGMALLWARIAERPVICAWGAHAMAEHRAERLIERAHDFQVSLECLGTTKSGAPKHPLYLPRDAPLRPFNLEPQP